MQMGLVRWWWNLPAGAEKPPKSQAAMKQEVAPSFSPSIGKKNGMDSSAPVNAKRREEIELTEEGRLGTTCTSFCLELWEKQKQQNGTLFLSFHSQSAPS